MDKCPKCFQEQIVDESGRCRRCFALMYERGNKIKVKETCHKCWFYNPEITDMMKAYRCKCKGHCPAIEIYERLNHAV